MFSFPRNNPFGFPTVGGFGSAEKRDVRMTQESTHDIIWKRDKSKQSQLAQNLKRRLKREKQ